MRSTTVTQMWKRRIGAVMMASSLVTAAAVTSLNPASAQEGAQAAEVQRAGFYEAPLTEVIPPAVISSFPPQALCLVEVKFCTGQLHDDQPEQVGEGYDRLRGGGSTATGAVREGDPGEPVSPVPDGTFPVSVTTGQPRYRSAVLFSLPDVPEGKQVDSFRIVLTEGQPTGGASSPAVRQAVLAAFTCVRGCEQDQFEKILTAGPAEAEKLGVEVCPIVDDPSTERDETKWEGERSQPEKQLPAVDCILGSLGERQDDGTWVFDLTFAMQDWTNAVIPNAGVLIRPQSPPNFAFGDPDSSFNKQVTFDGSVKYTIATSDEPEPLDTSFGDPVGGGSDGGGFSGGSQGSSSGSSGGFSSPSGGTSGGTSGNVSTFSAPADSTSGSAPVVAESGGGEGAPAAGLDSQPVAAGPEEEPGSAWYVWLLVPLFLGGMWMTAQTLTAEPQAVASGRSGAMSRLLERQRAADLAPPEMA